MKSKSELRLFASSNLARVVLEIAMVKISVNVPARKKAKQTLCPSSPENFQRKKYLTFFNLQSEKKAFFRYLVSKYTPEKKTPKYPKR